jgi:hypothetical protein
MILTPGDRAADRDSVHKIGQGSSFHFNRTNRFERRMEASEEPRMTFSRVDSREVSSLVGNKSSVRDLIANDDRRTGFARLELMVNTVFEHLTATDGRAGGDAGAIAGT